MPPPEAHLRRSAVDLQYLPCKGGHHPLEGLVRRSEVRGCWTIELVCSNDSIVGADLKHVFSRLRRPTVDGKAVIGMIDRSPIFEVALE